MALAICNGLLTSIMLETIILLRQMPLRLAFKTAIGMSLISMIGMELAMNLVDVAVTGGAILTLGSHTSLLLADSSHHCRITIGVSKHWERPATNTSGAGVDRSYTRLSAGSGFDKI